MLTTRLRALLLVSAFLITATASARVISYAPFTDAVSFPALGHRLNRHFVLIERPSSISGYGASGHVVLYDSTGEREPRTVFPPDGSTAYYIAAAVREDARQNVSIFIGTNHNFQGTNPAGQIIYLLSTDSGATWKKLALPNRSVDQLFRSTVDVGGPYARGRHSPVRVGTERWPFAVATQGGAYAIGRDGEVRHLVVSEPNFTPQLVGSDVTGRLHIIRSSADILSIADLEGVSYTFGQIQSGTGGVEGWISPDGPVFLELRQPGGNVLKVVRENGTVETLGPDRPRSAPGSNNTSIFFAVPTADFRGAWMIERGPDTPTILRSWTPAQGQTVHWADQTRPEVEALHAGASGRTLLVQVHRPRPQPDQRIFLDPALAVWTVGEPAPVDYDELFMNEQPTKAFIRVDPDRIKQGEPFVFDSGYIQAPPPQVIISPWAGGGGDVIQEWGVVRGSLVQRLVLPGISRTQGAYGSNWVSDVIFENPDTMASQTVSIRYVPTGSEAATAVLRERVLTLQPGEIRLVQDALKELFDIDAGGGAFFITPQRAITATARTYSRTTAGTYGFSMNAIDVYSAVGPRFPVSFSGAFPGQQFRTNLIVTDTSGFGSESSLTASGTSGLIGAGSMLTSPVSGQTQTNNLGGVLQLQPYETGALLVTPTRGSVIASLFAIDNLTNDPTYFPPDLPASVTRTIAVIGHIDGANNSRFRSDLYLFNPATTPRSVTLQMKMWDSPENQTLTLTLLPREARVIRDALFTAFGRTGLARLRYQSTRDSLGVRVTSRTYSIDANGGTYGFLMPPLNNFQMAGPGDTLELLGTVIDERYRTNIGLVDAAAFASNFTPEVQIDVYDNQHRKLDSFRMTVPPAGGTQVNDVFRNRGLLGRGPMMPVLIKVTSITGMVGAYATMTDNGTNDSSYIGANLGSQN